MGLFTQVLRPYVAPPRDNKALSSKEQFMSRAANQLVNWQLLTPETMAIARRQEKPILLMVGLSSSGLGRELDQFSFADSEIARFMNANFVCTRVDGLDSPELLNSFYPVTRLRMHFLPAIQLWILDPAGRVVQFIGREPASPSFSRDEFFDALIDSVANFRLHENEVSLPAGAVIQDEDRAALTEGGAAPLPNFATYSQRLLGEVDQTHGGFPSGGMQLLRPGALRYLCQAGYVTEAERALLPMATSPMFDLQDGGFFRLSITPDFSMVELNKEALSNAEMLSLIGILQCMSPRSIYGFLGRQTFDLLDTRMRLKQDLAAFQLEQEPRQIRNPRYSFNLRRMRDTLTDPERTWSRDHLGLDIPKNPQMIPFLLDAAAYDRNEFFPILRKLRNANANLPRRLSGLGYLEVDAFAAARMVEYARLTGDRKRMARAIARVRELKRYAKGGELVRHTNPDGSIETAGLGDYLSYSDAYLQTYLATGDESFLSEGHRALVRAERSFRGSSPGAYLMSSSRILIPESSSPEIADNFKESQAGQLIRLALDYGRLRGDVSLNLIARQVARRYSSIAEIGGSELGGYFASSASLADSRYAVATGPNRVELSSSLQRLRPARLVAPGSGDRWRNLAPGIYVVSDRVAGPFTPQGAALVLNSALQVGNNPAP
jgi:uncharacterized protein YyaL (SSP411 family)